MCWVLLEDHPYYEDLGWRDGTGHSSCLGTEVVPKGGSESRSLGILRAGPPSTYHGRWLPSGHYADQCEVLGLVPAERGWGVGSHDFDGGGRSFRREGQEIVTQLGVLRVLHQAGLLGFLAVDTESRLSGTFNAVKEIRGTGEAMWIEVVRASPKHPSAEGNHVPAPVKRSWAVTAREATLGCGLRKQQLKHSTGKDPWAGGVGEGEPSWVL